MKSKKWFYKDYEIALKDKIEYHNNLINQLEKQIKLLQNRIDRAYLDKLDQKISEDFWLTNNEKWVSEKEQLSMKLLAAQNADSSYLEDIKIILELARNAAQWFKIGSAEKKRRLLELLTSNCTYNGGNVDVELKPVFGMIFKSAKTGNWCTFENIIRDSILRFGFTLQNIKTVYSSFKIEINII